MGKGGEVFLDINWADLDGSGMSKFRGCAKINARDFEGSKIINK